MIDLNISSCMFHSNLTHCIRHKLIFFEIKNLWVHCFLFLIKFRYGLYVYRTFFRLFLNRMKIQHFEIHCLTDSGASIYSTLKVAKKYFLLYFSGRAKASFIASIGILFPILRWNSWKCYIVFSFSALIWLTTRISKI